jgi:hypothetical protein
LKALHILFKLFKLALPLLINSEEEKKNSYTECMVLVAQASCVVFYTLKYYARMHRFQKWFICCFQGCGRLKTPFEHATTVCSKYRERVRRLSGFGMQISPVARKISLLFLLYLTMPSVAEIIQCQMVGQLVSNELERMWKEAILV